MIDSLTKICTKIQLTTEVASAPPPAMYEIRWLLYEMGENKKKEAIASFFVLHEGFEPSILRLRI